MTLADGRKIRPADQLGAATDVVVHPGFRMILLANRPGFPFLGNREFPTRSGVSEMPTDVRPLLLQLSCVCSATPSHATLSLIPKPNRRNEFSLSLRRISTRRFFAPSSWPLEIFARLSRCVHPYSSPPDLETNALRRPDLSPTPSLSASSSPSSATSSASPTTRSSKSSATSSISTSTAPRRSTPCTTSFASTSSPLDESGSTPFGSGATRRRSLSSSTSSPRGIRAWWSPSTGRIRTSRMWEATLGLEELEVVRRRDWEGGCVLFLGSFGLGGRELMIWCSQGGYMRLYKGHDINQIPDELKADVPEEVKQQARDMARYVGHADDGGVVLNSFAGPSWRSDLRRSTSRTDRLRPTRATTTPFSRTSTSSSPSSTVRLPLSSSFSAASDPCSSRPRGERGGAHLAQASERRRARRISLDRGTHGRGSDLQATWNGEACVLSSLAASGWTRLIPRCSRAWSPSAQAEAHSLHL